MSLERNANKVVGFQRKNSFWHKEGLNYLVQCHMAKAVEELLLISRLLDFQPQFFLYVWPPVPTPTWHLTHSTNICGWKRNSEGNLQWTKFLVNFGRTPCLLRNCSSTISGWEGGYSEVRLWSQVDFSLNPTFITHNSVTSVYLRAIVFSTIKWNY